MRRLNKYSNDLYEALDDFEDYCAYMQWRVTRVTISDFVAWLEDYIDADEENLTEDKVCGLS